MVSVIGRALWPRNCSECSGAIPARTWLVRCYVLPHFGRSMVDPGTPDDPLPGFVKAEQASSGKPAWNQQALGTRAPGNLKQQLHAVGTQVDEAASIATSLAFR